MSLFGDNWTVASAVFLVVWILIGILFVSPEYARQSRIDEVETARIVFGNETAKKAAAFADKTFAKHFVESGLLEKMKNLYIPSESARERATGIENLGTGVFAWMASRIETLAIMLYGMYHRSYMIGMTLLFTMTLPVAALVDALVIRKIAILNFETANSVFYHGAKRGLIWLLLMPVFMVISPITITAPFLVIWAAVLPVVIWVGAKNVQEM